MTIEDQSNDIPLHYGTVANKHCTLCIALHILPLKYSYTVKLQILSKIYSANCIRRTNVRTGDTMV